MFAVEVRDAIMIAHSLPDPMFGPAANKHGATFVVDVAFFRDQMTSKNIVVDIGRALDVLKSVLKPLSYQDLDNLSQFEGKLTTTEFVCKHIFDEFVKAIKQGGLGEEAVGINRLRITLGETHVARAWYEGDPRG